MGRKVHGIRASFYKFRCRKAYWLHLAAPLLAIAVFGWYDAGRGGSGKEMAQVYLQAVGIAFPFLISIVVTQQFEAERRAGNFGNLLFYPAARIVGHAANITVLLLWGLLASLLASAGFGALLLILGYREIPLAWYAEMGILLWACNIGWYFFNYMVCYCFGDGISLGTGTVGSMLSALMLLGLGDGIWYIIPCSYGARAVSYASLFQGEREMGAVLKAELNRQIALGIPMICIITITIAFAFFLWGKRWQAEKFRE